MPYTPAKSAVDFGAALQGGLANMQGQVQQQMEQQSESLWNNIAGSLGGSALGGIWTGTNSAASLSCYNINVVDIQRMVASMSDPKPREICVPIPQTDYYVDYSPNSISYPTYATVTVPTDIFQIAYPSAGIPQAFQYQTWMSGSLGSVFTYGCMPSETPEETAARQSKREAATKRAEGLLFSILRPEQVRQYSDHGYFETAVDDRIYRITKGHSGNVQLIRDGKAVAKFCAHPVNAYQTPEIDTMISQLLALRTNEKRFLETANKTVLYA